MAPALELPLTVRWPVPFASKSKSIFESPPVADILGGLPVAALVISNWLTAELVVWNITCSLPFSSLIPCASSISILCEFVSKLPPSWGDVSATTLAIPVAIVSTFGLVPSLAVANTIASPLSVAEKVNVSPEPDAYLNCTVYAPEV